MEFQVVGDLHFPSIGFGFCDFSEVLIPSKPFLLTTGDIVQPFSRGGYDFYMYCAKNWDQTYIMMGNQEYEAVSDIFQTPMKKHFAVMKDLIDCINLEVGSTKLVFIQNTFVDLPEKSLRIAGLTLWADGAIKEPLKTDEIDIAHVDPENIHISDEMFELKTPGSTQQRLLPVFSWNPKKNAGIDDIQYYMSATQEDITILQEKDTVFLTKMLSECTEKGYKLLICSHYIPTTLIKKESPIIRVENNFPIDFFCRDMTPFLRSPLVAWVCGHVHLEQTVVVNNIPIYINNKTITV